MKADWGAELEDAGPGCQAWGWGIKDHGQPWMPTVKPAKVRHFWETWPQPLHGPRIQPAFLGPSRHSLRNAKEQVMGALPPTRSKIEAIK